MQKHLQLLNVHIRTYLRTCIPTYAHTYTHTYLRTYLRSLLCSQHSPMYIYTHCSQTFVQSHALDTTSLSLQHNNKHAGNCFTGLCTKHIGYNNNLVIAARCSGTSDGVVAKRFDCRTQWNQWWCCEEV